MDLILFFTNIKKWITQMQNAARKGIIESSGVHLKRKTKSTRPNERGQMGVFQLEERLHYHCAGSVQYISRVDHWLPGLTGKGIWSITRQPIDFGLLICRSWHKANGNVPPCARWLNVILFLTRCAHIPPVSYFLWLTFGDLRSFFWGEKKTLLHLK